MAIALRAKLDEGYARALASDPRGTIERSPWLGQERKAALLARPRHELAMAAVKPCCPPAVAGAGAGQLSSNACACPPQVPPRHANPSRAKQRREVDNAALLRAIDKVVDRARRDPLFATAATGRSGAWRQAAIWLPSDEWTVLKGHPIGSVAAMVARGLSRGQIQKPPTPRDPFSRPVVTLQATDRLQQLLDDVDVTLRTGPWYSDPSLSIHPGAAGYYPLDQLYVPNIEGYPSDTLGQSRANYGVIGAGHGYSFVHGAALFFVFGDSVPFEAYDVVGYLDLGTADPELGLTLDFLTGAKPFYSGQLNCFPDQLPTASAWQGQDPYVLVVRPDLTTLPSNLPYFPSMVSYTICNHQMGGDEITYSGISVNGVMYLACHLNHTPATSATGNPWTTDFTVLVQYVPGRVGQYNSTFPVVRIISYLYNGLGGLAGGNFLQPSFHEYTADKHSGLTTGEKYILTWGTNKFGPNGTGQLHLAAVLEKDFGTSHARTRYLTKVVNGTPHWSKPDTFDSQYEDFAVPLQVDLPILGLTQDSSFFMQSIAWVESLGIWIMMYDSRPVPNDPSGLSAGIRFCHSKHPWGPWNSATVYDRSQGMSLSTTSGFIHVGMDMRQNMDDGLDGPYIGNAPAAHPNTPSGGGAFSPMLIEPMIFYVDAPMLHSGTLYVYWVLSTSVPYYVVLMRSTFQVTP